MLNVLNKIQPTSCWWNIARLQLGPGRQIRSEFFDTSDWLRRDELKYKRPTFFFFFEATFVCHFKSDWISGKFVFSFQFVQSNRTRHHLIRILKKFVKTSMHSCIVTMATNGANVATVQAIHIRSLVLSWIKLYNRICPAVWTKPFIPLGLKPKLRHSSV